MSDRMVRESDAQQTIDEVTLAFLSAIDTVVTDTELAEKIKVQAHQNILRKALEALMQSMGLDGPEGEDIRNIFNK